MTEKRIERYLYRTTSNIGEGSFGKVYRGTDEKTGQQVAIKAIPKNLIDQDLYLKEGLMSEIKIMQKLKSPNVVAFLDVLETTNNYYIIQEFCDSGDFSHQLKKLKTLPEAKVQKLMLDILNGFVELIKHGIIHRDLKPANILINGDTYKLADFGFAKCVDNFKNSMVQSAVGTPLYMSPQILEAEKYTSKCDVWSMGFILYEALYGQTPWTGRSIPELSKNIKNIPLKFFDERVQVSENMKELLRGCLQADETKRLSWQEIIKGPLFRNNFAEYLNSHSKFDDRALYIANNLRQTIIRDRIDLENLFNEIDRAGNKHLTVIELGGLLRKMDKDLTREEIEFIFNKIDIDQSNSIEFGEFKAWLQQNEVRMSMQPHVYQKSATQTFSSPQTPVQNPQTQGFNSPQTPASNPYQKQPSFEAPVSNPYQKQPSFEANPQAQQFLPSNQPPTNSWGANTQYAQQPPVQVPGWGAPPQQPQQQWGQNAQGLGQNSQTWSAGQSTQNSWGQQTQVPQYGQQTWQQPATTQYGNSWTQPPAQSPYGMSLNLQVDQTQPVTAQIVGKIKLAIQRYNINIHHLFQKYDMSNNNSLECWEFGQMIQKIDPTIQDQCIKQTFLVFDDKNTGSITFEQFKAILQPEAVSQPPAPYNAQAQPYNALAQPKYQQPQQYPTYPQNYSQNGGRPFAQQ